MPQEDRLVRMDGVPCRWSKTRLHDSVGRPRPTADTLSKLAKLVARAEQKQDTRRPRQRPHAAQSCICPECGEGFLDMSGLVQHQELQHTLPKPHQCSSCGEEFSLLSSLQLHKAGCDSAPCKLLEDGQELDAPCLGFMAGAAEPSSPRKKLPHHQPHLLDNIPYACAPCGRGFSQKQALLFHQHAGCSEPASPLAVDGTSSPPAYSPPSASDVTSTPSDSSDCPGPSSNKLKQCPFCPRSFRNGAGLFSHKRLSHPEEMRTLGADQNIKGGARMANSNSQPGRISMGRCKAHQKELCCRSCDMVFKTTAKLYVHRKEKHSREKHLRKDQTPGITKRRTGETYPCPVCGRVFLHHLSLMSHSKQHAASSITTVHKQKRALEIVPKHTKVAGKYTHNAKLAGKNMQKRKNDFLASKNVSVCLKKPGMKVASVEFSGPGRPSKVPIMEEQVEEEEEEEEEKEVEEDRDFPCPSCPEVFSFQSDLREHMDFHQSSVWRGRCGVCAQEMDTSKQPGSKRHRLYHCVPCHRAFSALDTFLEHCQDHLRVRVEMDGIAESYTLCGNKN